MIWSLRVCSDPLKQFYTFCLRYEQINLSHKSDQALSFNAELNLTWSMASCYSRNLMYHSKMKYRWTGSQLYFRCMSEMYADYISFLLRVGQKTGFSFLTSPLILYVSGIMHMLKRELKEFRRAFRKLVCLLLYHNVKNQTASFPAVTETNYVDVIARHCEAT